MSSIFQVSSSSTAASTVVASAQASSLAVTSATLSYDAGVVMSLSGASPNTVDASSLYDNLAAMSQSLANVGLPSVPTSSGTPVPAADSAGVSPLDPNSAWASVLKANPALAGEATQLSTDQAIVNTFA